MPTVRKVRRVANPRRKSRRPMTAKQIQFFGTKRQKAALKAARRRGAARRKSNPALVLTLGAVNPKRSKSMATRKRRRRTVARSAKGRFVRRRKARNPRRRVARRRTIRRRRTVRRRRNPSFFNTQMSGKAMTQAVLGGLVGVAATKFIPTALPINLGGGNVVRTLMSGVSAFIAKMVAEKVLGKQFADAVLFGGLMQTGSVALNAFLPSVGSYIGLTGMGELVDTGGFVLPHNPVLAPAIPAQERIGQNGLDRAWGRAF